MPKKITAEKINLNLQYFNQAVGIIAKIWDPSQTQVDREYHAQSLTILMNNSETVHNECLNNVFLTPESLTTTPTLPRCLKYRTSTGTVDFPLPESVKPVPSYDPTTGDPEIPIPDNIVLNSLILLKYKADSLTETDLHRHFTILTLAAERIYVAPFLYTFYSKNPESTNYNLGIASNIILTCYNRILGLGEAYKTATHNILNCALRYYYNDIVEKTNGMQWDSTNPAEIMPLLIQFEQCLNENMAVKSNQAYCLAYLIYRHMPAEIYQLHQEGSPTIRATKLLCEGAKMDDPGCIVHLLYGHRAEAFKITEANKLEHYLQQAYKLTLEDVNYLNDETINKFLVDIKLAYEKHLADKLAKIVKSEQAHGNKSGKSKMKTTKQVQLEKQRKADQDALDEQVNQRKMAERARAEALRVKEQTALQQAKDQAERDAKVAVTKVAELLTAPESHSLRIDLPIGDELKAAGVISRYRHNPYS